MSLNSLPWKHHSQYSKEAINYLVARKQGKISSLRTPWKDINKSSINGLERNTITIFAGRPAHGKTTMLDQLIKSVFKLNPKLDLRVMAHNYEMLGRSSKIRELTSVTKKSYKDLCSADEPLEANLLKECNDYFEKTKKNNVDIVDVPQTVEGFKKMIIRYMEHHSKIVPTKNKEGEIVDRKVYANTLITLDHALLIQCKNDKRDMLYELGEALNQLKKRYPVWFVILSQLNRDCTKPERNKDGQSANHILESDLFGADALMQYADNIYAITIPAKRSIQYYGPEEYIIMGNETIAVVHVIKSRSGITGILFLKADFKTMSFLDSEDPPIKPKRVRVRENE